MKVYSGNSYRKNRSYYKKPFHKTRGFYFLIIIVLAIMAFVYFSIRNTENNQNTNPKFTDQDTLPITMAKVTDISGDLEVKVPEQDWEKVSNNFQVEQGSQVRTTAGSRAIIELPDKSLVRLDENTEIKIEQMGMADIIIEQVLGTAYHRVNDESTAIYRVKNGNVEITALGTAFNVLTTSNLTYLTVIESRTKVKIYQDDSIVNMRTIDAGTKALINPSKDLEDMIETETVSTSDLLEKDWYSWNLEKDREHEFYLGLFEEAVKLVITEPSESDLTTDEEKITIKGATDPDAEIFMSGKEIDNNNGSFETEYLLGSGENEIEITVKVGKNQNKKTITVNSTKQKEVITLSGTSDGSTVDLSWTTENLDEYKELKVLKSNAESPTYPNSPYHTLDNDDTKDMWANLEDGTYHFRVCAFTKEDKCEFYSNDFSATIGESDTVSGEIQLNTKIEADNVNLTWTISNDLNPDDGFKTIISQTANPVYPGNSYHSLTSNSRNDTWKKLEPGTYHFRICLLQSGSCVKYSNDKTATVTEASSAGNISLSGSAVGNRVNLSWINDGTEINKGFKSIMNTNPGAKLPGEDHHLITSSSATTDSWTNLEQGTTYYFRVCQNLGSTCGVYSNEISVAIE
jgi:hypothetical protein